MLFAFNPYNLLTQDFFIQIDRLIDEGFVTQHISEMKIQFVTDVELIRYDYYFQMPKQYVERNIIRKLKDEIKLIKRLNKMPEPILRKFEDYLYDTDDEDSDDED